MSMRKILILIVVFLLAQSTTLFAKQLVYNSDRYRDPLKSWLPEKIEKEALPRKPIAIGVKGAEVPDLVIQGMVWDTDMPQAIIDGNVYKVGDRFQDGKILEINKDGVKILYNNRIFVARPEISKKSENSRR